MTKYFTDEERRIATNIKCAEYRRKYPDRVRATKERWRKKNMDRYRAYAATQRIKHPERIAKTIAKWSQKNKSRLAANKAIRMANKKKATPKWADKAAMQKFYELAREMTRRTGIKHSVDHIVPMKSDLVQGLHVEHNLRVIPHIQNISKKNRYWPDMPV